MFDSYQRVYIYIDVFFTTAPGCLFSKCIKFTLEIFVLLLYEFQTCNAKSLFILIIYFLILVICFLLDVVYKNVIF